MDPNEEKFTSYIIKRLKKVFSDEQFASIAKTVNHLYGGRAISPTQNWEQLPKVIYYSEMESNSWAESFKEIMNELIKLIKEEGF